MPQLEAIIRPTADKSDALVTPFTRSICDLVIACELVRSRAAREWGRSPVEVTALVLIHLGESMIPRQIGERLNLTTGSVTALLDRLELAHLVERQTNPNDRRSLLIVATPMGAHLVDKYLLELDSALAGVVQDRSPADIAELTHTMRSIGIAIS